MNFIFGLVCLFVCVCVFSLHRESPNMILGDKPLISEVVLSQLETYRIYEPVFQTIKVVTRNLSGASNFIA
jgi:hypothetical protein